MNRTVKLFRLSGLATQPKRFGKYIPAAIMLPIITVLSGCQSSISSEYDSVDLRQIAACTSPIPTPGSEQERICNEVLNYGR